MVGEAADGRDAVDLARELRPDVCLLDIRMPELDGLEATRLLAGPDVVDPIAVVVVTTFDLDEYVHAALKTAPAVPAQGRRAGAAGRGGARRRQRRRPGRPESPCGCSRHFAGAARRGAAGASRSSR